MGSPNDFTRFKYLYRRDHGNDRMEKKSEMSRMLRDGIKLKNLKNSGRLRNSPTTGMFRDAVIAILATIAKQEHARLSERVVAGLRRAKHEGKVLGRKRIIVDRERIRAMHANGESVRAIASKMGVSKSLVANILQ